MRQSETGLQMSLLETKPRMKPQHLRQPCPPIPSKMPPPPRTLWQPKLQGLRTEGGRHTGSDCIGAAAIAGQDGLGQVVLRRWHDALRQRRQPVRVWTRRAGGAGSRRGGGPFRTQAKVKVNNIWLGEWPEKPGPSV